MRQEDGRRDRATAAIIGVFDGVHQGHQVLLRRLLAVAQTRNLTPLVVTFDPHPAAVVDPEREPAMLTVPRQKEALLRSFGVETVISIAFDRPFARLSPREFALYLVSTLRVAWVGVGFNFRFGAGGAGTPETMTKLGGELGFAVEVLPPYRADGTVVSSSLIRQVLEAGRVEEATGLLGHPYWITGKVISGDGRGRTIGYPTANVAVHPKQLLPLAGVYAVKGRLPDGEWPGAANLGVRPTFAGHGAMQLEVHFIGWAGDLYGQAIEVGFFRRLRAEKAFPSVTALTEQLAKDTRETETFFAAAGK